MPTYWRKSTVSTSSVAVRKTLIVSGGLLLLSQFVPHAASTLAGWDAKGIAKAMAVAATRRGRRRSGPRAGCDSRTRSASSLRNTDWGSVTVCRQGAARGTGLRPTSARWVQRCEPAAAPGCADGVRRCGVSPAAGAASLLFNLFWAGLCEGTSRVQEPAHRLAARARRGGSAVRPPARPAVLLPPARVASGHSQLAHTLGCGLLTAACSRVRPGLASLGRPGWLPWVARWLPWVARAGLPGRLFV